MSCACACMGPRPGHRYCPCREKNEGGEPIHLIGHDVPPGHWDNLTRLLKIAPRLPDDDMTNDPPPIV